MKASVKINSLLKEISNAPEELGKALNFKLSSVSGKKRIEAKKEKIFSQFIIENWNDLEILKKEASENSLCDHCCNDLFEVMTNRIEELEEIVNTIERLTKEKNEKESAEKITEKENEPEKGEKVKKVSKSTKKIDRKVGDIHSNGKWIWTEYKPGKFDWRTIKKTK